MHQLFDHLHSHRLLGASRRTLDVEEESVVSDYGQDIDDEITSDYDPGILLASRIYKACVYSCIAQNNRSPEELRRAPQRWWRCAPCDGCVLYLVILQGELCSAA